MTRTSVRHPSASGALPPVLAAAAPVRATVRAVQAWGLARGRRPSTAAVAVAVGAAHEAGLLGGGRADHRATAFSELAWHGLVRWCQVRRLALPPDALEALWLLIGWMGETGLLHRGEAPVLQAQLVVCGLGPDGRTPVRSAARSRRPAPKRSAAGKVVPLRPLPA